MDFQFKVDNLFMELSRIKEVSDTPELRAPFENLTIKADIEVKKNREKLNKQKQI